MNFSKEESENIKKFLTDTKHTEISEFELKLGRNINGKYTPGVDKKDFDFLYNAHKKNKFIKTVSTDSIYTNGMRKTSVLNNFDSIEDPERKKEMIKMFKKEKITWIVKKKLDDLKNENFNFRLTHSSETTIENPPNEKELTLKMKREKTRHSCFLTKNIRLDLTEINTDNILSFEAEVEFIKHIPDFSSFMNFLNQFLTVYQQSRFVISNQEKNRVVKEYKDLLMSAEYRISKPVSLNFEDINSDFQKKYAVTDKADGEFSTIFLTKSFNLYIIDKLFNVRKLYIFTDSKYPSTIIEGENISNSVMINGFFSFNIPILNGKNIEGKSLDEKINIMNDVITSFKTNIRTNEFSLNVKKFHFYMKPSYNLFKGAVDILNKKYMYNLDGLIFTPINKTNSNKYLKWKIPELISIDFLIRKKENNTWDLYVGDKDKNIPFVFEGKEYSTKISKEDNDKYNNNSIVEMVFLDGKFLPLRQRYDKVKPNYKTVAIDEFKHIINPIKKEHIINLSFEKKIDDNRKFINMRIFNNAVKRTVITNVVKTYKIDNLLSLASGKGGDLDKWSKAGIKKVLGLDVNKEYIKDAISRRNNRKAGLQTSSVEYKYADLTKPIELNNKFDGIECNFALHYFLKDEETFRNFMSNVVNHLKVGGVFYGTILDGKLIHDKKGQVLKNEHFSIEKKYDYTKNFDDLSLFGKKIKVDIDLETIQVSEEYLINFDKLVKVLNNTYGLVLKNSNHFENLYRENYNMEKYEKDYSFLSMFFIFEYKGGNSNFKIGMKEAFDLLNIDEKKDNMVYNDWDWKPLEEGNGKFFYKDYTDEEKNFLKLSKHKKYLVSIYEGFKFITPQSEAMYDQQNFYLIILDIYGNKKLLSYRTGEKKYNILFDKDKQFKELKSIIDSIYNKKQPSPKIMVYNNKVKAVTEEGKLQREKTKKDTEVKKKEVKNKEVKSNEVKSNEVKNKEKVDVNNNLTDKETDREKQLNKLKKQELLDILKSYKVSKISTDNKNTLIMKILIFERK